MTKKQKRIFIFYNIAAATLCVFGLGTIISTRGLYFNFQQARAEFNFANSIKNNQVFLTLFKSEFDKLFAAKYHDGMANTNNMPNAPANTFFSFANLTEFADFDAYLTFLRNRDETENKSLIFNMTVHEQVNNNLAGETFKKQLEALKNNPILKGETTLPNTSNMMVTPTELDTEAFRTVVRDTNFFLDEVVINNFAFDQSPGQTSLISGAVIFTATLAAWLVFLAVWFIKRKKQANDPNQANQKSKTHPTNAEMITKLNQTE